MNYCSVTEMAERWHQTPRSIQKYCAQGQIPGAVRFGRAWMLPENTEKPGNQQLSSYQSAVMLCNITPFTVGKADQALTFWRNPTLRQIAEAELGYYRGQLTLIPDDIPNIPFALITYAVVAIGQGNYTALNRCLEQLDRLRAEATDDAVRWAAEVHYGVLTTSMYVPQMCPDWLQNGELWNVPTPMQPTAVYAYSKYLHSVGRIQEMQGVAETALLSMTEDTYTIVEIYIRLMAMLACAEQQNHARATWHLDIALEKALPDGLIIPFCEHLTAFPEERKKTLKEQSPALYQEIYHAWEESNHNWISIHNDYAKEHITTLLTLRECQVATLLVRGHTYQETADHLQLSVGRIKNITQTIYDKLLVRKRSELKKFIQ